MRICDGFCERFVGDSVTDSVCESVRDSMRDFVRDSVKEFVRGFWKARARVGTGAWAGQGQGRRGRQADGKAFFGNQRAPTPGSEWSATTHFQMGRCRGDPLTSSSARLGSVKDSVQDFVGDPVRDSVLAWVNLF